MTWREAAKPVIFEVIRGYEGKDEKELKKLISEAYPFGVRKHYPYKVWLDEVKKQVTRWKGGKAPIEAAPEGFNLFNQGE